MNRTEIIEDLSKELSNDKSTRINIRMSKELYDKIVAYKQKSGLSISNLIRISLIKFFIENENKEN